MPTIPLAIQSADSITQNELRHLREYVSAKDLIVRLERTPGHKQGQKPPAWVSYPEGGMTEDEVRTEIRSVIAELHLKNVWLAD